MKQIIKDLDKGTIYLLGLITGLIIGLGIHLTNYLIF